LARRKLLLLRLLALLERLVPGFSATPDPQARDRDRDFVAHPVTT